MSSRKAGADFGGNELRRDHSAAVTRSRRTTDLKIGWRIKNAYGRRWKTGTPMELKTKICDINVGGSLMLEYSQDEGTGASQEQRGGKFTPE